MAKAKHSILSQGGFGREQGAIIDTRRAVSFPEKPGTYGESDEPVPFIVLFEHYHFEGAIGSSFFDLSNIGDWWADKVASIVVAAGVWEIFPRPNYEGEPWVLGPGLYDDIHITIGSLKARQKPNR
jgi:Beta/Gamma crystallin